MFTARGLIASGAFQTRDFNAKLNVVAIKLKLPRRNRNERICTATERGIHSAWPNRA
jgi:hypothetical protein